LSDQTTTPAITTATTITTIIISRKLVAFVPFRAAYISVEQTSI